MKMKKPLLFLAAIAVCQAAGALGALFNAVSLGTWYPALVKPSFNPPSWVFAPVWTTLFLLMGVSLYLFIERGVKDRIGRAGLAMFAVQWILNVAWSGIFFGLRQPFWAFGEIILLWLSIVLTIYFFSRKSRAAAWLLTPYLLWVSFASFLNFNLWWLNK